MKDLIKKLLKENLNEMVKGGSYQAFHGSETKFANFSDEFVGAEEANDQEGPGIYFTSDLSEAEKYGGNLYSVTLTPRLMLDDSPTNPRKLRGLLTKLVRMAPNWKETAQNYDENPMRGLTEFIETTFDYNEKEKDCLLQVWIDFYRYNPVDYVRNCTELGIDGIQVKDTRYRDSVHYIIYNPSIISLV
jgi:hypothetical protein